MIHDSDSIPKFTQRAIDIMFNWLKLTKKRQYMFMQQKRHEKLAREGFIENLNLAGRNVEYGPLI